MAVYSSLWLAMVALVVTYVTAELSANSTAMPEEEALVLDVIKDAPKEAVYFVFDIKGTQLTSDDVNKAFEGLPVPYKFKVLGGHRYIVVLKSEPGDRAALRDLVIPQATDVEVFTAESLHEFLKYSDVQGLQNKEGLPLKDEDLYMVELTILERGLDLTTFKNNIKKLSKGALAANKFDVHIIHVTASLPFKFIAFLLLSPYRIDRSLVEVSRYVGGPYQMELRTQPIVNI
ncbi:uncharacterized protein LOC112558057 [Pomacea canaliculata]|uniref:uncharacterized protein LOC112558057 n=1 Tax=Pomacea canaliculata TaxID=400727 RepID=UPI000D7312A7|nr:uncharacterized protein LOC112558057 [Pomacea canaliculata]